MYGIALFAMPSLEQHALVPPPSSPTPGSWPSGHPAAWDQSSLVRHLIGCAWCAWSLFGTLVPRSHGRRHPLKPVLRDFTSNVAHSPRRGASRTAFAAHGTILREDALIRSPWGVYAPTRWKGPWLFENVDHAWRDWPRARPADICETLSRNTTTCAA